MNTMKKMKLSKKVFALSLSIAILLPLLTACTSETPQADPDATSAQGDSQVSEPAAGGDTAESESESDTLPAGIDWTTHETFTWWTNSAANDYYASYIDNPVIKYLEEKFNVTFVFEEPVSGSEVDSLSLMFGTSQYTDLVAMNQYQGSWDELLEDGVIIDIADYLDYMPNLCTRMEADPGYKTALYNDEGQILSINSYPEESTKPWCGLVYRRDILEEMTGGNVQFPSGKDEPETIADWDYMLPLFKEYFEKLGLVEYAPLILPYNGYFPAAELTDSYGVYPYNFYVDETTVYFGPAQDGWREYLGKMNEWYKAGYIYQDFASRTQDMFFQPNTSLLYGNAAGIWMGMLSHLGDVMSDPASDVVYDVRPLKSPTAEGRTSADQIKHTSPPSQGSGLIYILTTACKNPEKLLAILDYMYSDEGGMLTMYGLTKDQIPADDTIYAANGLDEGAYWFDSSGSFVYNPLMDAVGGSLQSAYFAGEKIPGYIRNSYKTLAAADEVKNAYDKWCGGDDLTVKMPMPGISLTDEEEAATKGITMDLFLYTVELAPQFIVGTKSLDDESWNNYLAELEAIGLSLMLETNQTGYDRYLDR